MTVSVVGVPDRVIETLEAGGHAVRREAPPEVGGNASAVVTAGERDLLAVARERPAAPILALETDIGPSADDRKAIIAALDGGREHSRPLLDVSVGDESVASALMDVTLVTSEPARISEYAIDRDGERVATFRADGVVVATPTGSRGYAAAAGGPTLSPAVEAVCVVPIAPFHTRSNHWVLETDSLSLSVLRDAEAVSLLVDGTDHGAVDSDRRVELAVGGHVRTLHR